jgi:hypothetical protein
MVVTITTVVGIGLTTLIISFYRNNAYLLEENQALNSSRQGLGDMVSVIREVSYGEDGSYPVSTTSTSTLTVYGNIDRDNVIEKIKYTLLGTTLYRLTFNPSGNPPIYATTSVATTTIATDVRNSSSTPLFTYFDASGVQLSTTSPDLSKLVSVKIQLLVDLNPLRAPNVFTLTQVATPRNL